MSVFNWLFKSKKEMSKINTKCVKLGKYTITSHAQNRLMDHTRKATKWDLINNLFTKPNAITDVKKDHLGRDSYKRIGKKITTAINPNNNNVVTLYPVSVSERNKYNLVKRRNKYVKNYKSKNSRINQRKNY